MGGRRRESSARAPAWLPLLRADNRALKRAEARRLAPPSAALYGPATGRALEGPLLTGGELAVASKERPRAHRYRAPRSHKGEQNAADRPACSALGVSTLKCDSRTPVCGASRKRGHSFSPYRLHLFSRDVQPDEGKLEDLRACLSSTASKKWNRSVPFGIDWLMKPPPVYSEDPKTRRVP